MTQLLKSDLIRNFLGGFAIGAVALFVLLPADGKAYPAPHANTAVESPIGR